MTCYHLTHRGKYQYVCQSDSYWNKELKKAENNKTIIGKVINNSGKIEFNELFLKNYPDETIKIGDSIISIFNPYISFEKRNCINNIERDNININKDVIIQSNEVENLNIIQNVLDSYKKFGLTFLFNNIANSTNLINVLKSSIPKYWEQILNLSYYIVAEHKSMMYCDYWIDENGISSSYSYSSQGISKLFDQLTATNRNKFYQKWLKISRENEYLALDITSISSYSKNIELVEKGYNRDGENLKQVNLCTLFGQNSYLPMYQTEFSGSTNDVNTLKTIINEFGALLGDFNFTLVMDKGFFSLDNIKFMLSKNDIKFINSVPLTNKFATLAIQNFIKEPKTFTNYIPNVNNNEIVYGKEIFLLFQNNTIIINEEEEEEEEGKDSIDNKYDNKGNDIDVKKLFGYVLYNPTNDNNERDKFYTELNNIKVQIEQDKKLFKKTATINKYFNIEYDNNKEIINIKVNDHAVQEKLKYAGYFILLSNSRYKINDILNLYRKRNVVEQVFDNYKNHLGLDRFRIHGNKRMVNKSFLFFIALIIYSSIFKTMLDESLFQSKMTIEKLLLEFSKIMSYEVEGKLQIRPLTATQKKLLAAFKIDIPNA